MATVKRLTSDATWKDFESTPLDVPIDKKLWYYPIRISSPLGVYPNSANFVSCGSITIPKTGNYTFKWGVSLGRGASYLVSYELYKNGTVVQSGSSQTQDYSYSMQCNEGDVISISYKSARYSSGGTYYLGYGTCLMCFYDFNDQ